MPYYTIEANLDIADSSKNGKIPFSIFQGTKNLQLNLKIQKDGEDFSFTPTKITPYLVVYDRLDGLMTAYQLNDINTFNNVASLIVNVFSNVHQEIVKYANKCALILYLTDANGNQIVTTEFEYNVVPNGAYDFIN